MTMTRSRRSQLRITAEIVTAASGLCLALTIQMRWVSKGVGSTLAGYDLASALRQLPARGHPWALEAAIGIYAVAAIGCVVLMTALVRHRIVMLLRGFLTAITALVLVMLSIGGAMPMGLWSSGAIVTFAASTSTVLSAALMLVYPGEEET